MAHTINVDDFHEWLDDERWYDFASSVGSMTKRLQVRIGKEQFRVLRGQEIICETNSPSYAAKIYNETVKLGD